MNEDNPMMKLFPPAIVASVLLVAVSLAAEHDAHMSQKAGDMRREIDIPAPMKTHMLANMRAHQVAVADALMALSQGDGP